MQARFWLLVALLAVPSSVAGAVDLSLGVGGAQVSGHEDGRRVSSVRPQFQGRAAWRLGERVRLGFELGAYGLGDDRPRTMTFEESNSAPPAKVLGMTTLSLTAQIDVSRSLYLRPSLGLSRLAFSTYEVTWPAGADPHATWPTGIREQIDHDGTLAAGLAAGVEIRRAGPVRLGLEGQALASGAPSGAAWPRVAVGAQVVVSWDLGRPSRPHQ